jgi:uncharacterized protein (TIGR03066 family)
MRALMGVALVVGLVAAGSAAGQEKVDAKKLVGKWDLTTAPPGAKMVIEMTKDGKAVMTVEAGGKKETMEGTYKVDGNKLTVTTKLPGGKEDKDEMTITKLTDDELETKDSKGKVDKLKRVKK